MFPFSKPEKTSEKLSVISWVIFMLILIASFLAYLILQNSRSSAKIVNYSGKIRGGIQREVKFALEGNYTEVKRISREIKSYIDYLDRAAEKLKLPWIDRHSCFKPEEVVVCYRRLSEAINRHAPAEEIINLSEKCWQITDETTNFYQKIAERNFRILEMLFYVNMILVGVLAGILIKINIEEIKGDLEFSAVYDNLTRVFNRHSFIKIFEKLKKKPFEKSVILFDIDHFKSINDTYGHDVGDEVLRKVAAVVRKNLRKDDVIARWGGEEFVILLPKTNKKAATVVAEKLRNAIKSVKIPQMKGRVITASFGVTEVREGESLEKVLKRADEALYEAKRNGRDRVVTR
jgi:diguanylate cyclase (GGDEF)-like protein